MEFVVGELYSRDKLHQALGGGEPQTYLPQRDGEILAGCFGRDRNPEAPEEVQVGRRIQNIKKRSLVDTASLPVYCGSNR